MQTVVRLRLLDELENEEISSRLRIPAGTVKSRMSRGRSQLAGMLLPVRAALGAA
jgi:DNA-directed RNA polymerase specialized sigma24 family protein